MIPGSRWIHRHPGWDGPRRGGYCQHDCSPQAMTHAASIILPRPDENSDDVPKEMSVRRKTGAKACSMRHQDRNRHGSEDFSRHTPQDELPQPRMTVAAHNQEIG